MIFVNCTQPLQNENPDQIEFVSVWQYLKTFSIYQDRIPENPFVYESPQKMIDHIEDTLRGNTYTAYIDEYDNPVRFANTLKKSNINVKCVSVDSLTDSCCLLTISSFMDPETGAGVLEQFYNVLPKVKKFSKIIIDIRNNGGGDLVITNSIINDMLPKGMHYIHAEERVYDPTQKTASTVKHDWVTARSPKSEFANKKFAVLIDGGSASASEILASALKSCLGAPLIGVKSYGKGIGQIMLLRRGRLRLKITYVHFYRIKDQNTEKYDDYHRKGIAPDIVSSQDGFIDKPLVDAIKILEPSAAMNAIKLPASGSLSKSFQDQGGLFKIVDESSL